MYYTYMLRCKDNSIYTGITTDVKRRVEEHMQKAEKCAKYTISHDVLKLEAVWETENRADASKLEYHIKHLTKKQKENLIVEKLQLKDVLQEKINCEVYKKVQGI